MIGKTPSSERRRVVLKVPSKETKNWSRVKTSRVNTSVPFFLFTTSEPYLPGFTQLCVYFSLLFIPCCTPMMESRTGSEARQLSPSICSRSPDPHELVRTGAHQSKHGSICRGRADCESRPQRRWQIRALTRTTSGVVI